MVFRFFYSAIIAILLISAYTVAETIEPRVEVQEEVYSFVPANNEAGPMWCHGNTCIIRVGKEVFASGLETVQDVTPYNNCLPLLFRRTDSGWKQLYKGDRTREPNPLVCDVSGQLFLSINPTLAPPDKRTGPAEPQIIEFFGKQIEKKFSIIKPVWDGKPEFTQHSYRSFAADGVNGELILFQNTEYKDVDWTFRDGNGKWVKQGKLAWPWGDTYKKPQPIRICYPAVALKNRAVYFLGVSDIIEPNKAWRDYKKQITGKEWDYDFRRLFYAWSDDITTGKFHDWVEISSREKTCGWIFPQDLYVAPNGDVSIVWTERALDERLREKFYPGEKQSFTLEYAVIHDGKVTQRKKLVQGGEDLGGERPGDARFQITESGRLLVFYYVGGTTPDNKPLSENRLAEILPDGTIGKPITIKFEKPFSTFFSATTRAGCQPSNILDVYGQVDNTMRYARIRVE